VLAIIGGSGLSKLSSMADTRRKVVRTPYGDPSGALTFGRIRGKDVVFLARHGYGHTIAPHEVNYRANLWALKEEKVEGVVSVASVGGIRKDLAPGTLFAGDFRIVALLGHGELCVCHLEEALGVSQPKVSRHLGVLRMAGVVEDRRAGSWVYYKLARQADAACEDQLKALVRTFGQRSVLRKDLQRLVKLRGPESCK